MLGEGWFKGRFGFEGGYTQISTAMAVDEVSELWGTGASGKIGSRIYGIHFTGYIFKYLRRGGL